MDRPLVIVLGAGASYGCATPTVGANSAFRPPLVSNLFDASHFSVLNQYPLARQAGAEVRKAIELASQADESLAIENLIKERFVDSEDSEDRRKGFALPWYLQDLLWQASARYTENPDNYDVLVAETLRLDNVIFVTLNYDLILDNVLSVRRPFNDISSYIRPDSSWSLIKLHGSVNWGKKIFDSNFGRSQITAPAAQLVKHMSPDIELRDSSVLENSRWDKSTNTWYYPALSVPVGGDRELLNCPPQHVGFLQDRLRLAPIMDLLLIGYSANDQEVLDLFADAHADIGVCWVVNGGRSFADSAFEKILHRGIHPREPGRSGQGFEEFAQGPQLGDFLARVERAREGG